MKMVKVKRGMKFGRWTLISFLGRGGNGEVWKCKNDEDKKRAIKFLLNTNQKRYERFKDEIFILEKKSSLKGILHPIDKSLPEKISDGIPYYVMPIARPSFDKLKGKPIEEKVEAILQVAKTLIALHKGKIAHRDIKPANILYLNKNYFLADFGLVDYPEKQDISSIKEEIGAKWTIAPEMKRNAFRADGLKADVYSLAKTLWIVLTENLTGFDGQYSINSIIELKRIFRDRYTKLLDDLLQNCTDNDPDQRPTITQFVKILEEWKKLDSSFHLRNLRQWFELLTQLFPVSIPQRVIWNEKSEIIKILKILGSIKDINHMFFPNGGGMDLLDSRESTEVDCIELDCGYVEIVKPTRLIFESFDYDPEWNYFRLELDELEPTGVYGENETTNEEEMNDFLEEVTEIEMRDHEELSEVSPGVYGDFSIVENFSDYQEEYNLTENSRQVTRWFRGNFVIFCKRSRYNRTTSTYDGRHNKMTTDEFRKYIEDAIKYIKTNGKSEE